MHFCAKRVFCRFFHEFRSILAEISTFLRPGFPKNARKMPQNAKNRVKTVLNDETMPTESGVILNDLSVFKKLPNRILGGFVPVFPPLGALCGVKTATPRGSVMLRFKSFI